MPTPIYAYKELEGVCYDALKMLHDNNTRGAYNLLAKKLLRMQRYETEQSYKIIWNTLLGGKIDAVSPLYNNVSDSIEEESFNETGVLSEVSRIKK
jgi:hypothetical protein